MQTARGASLSGRDGGAASGLSSDVTPDPALRRSCLRWFALVATLGYLADLVTKQLVVAHLTGHGPVDVVGSLLRLELARNPGAAFSTGTSYTLVFTVVAVAAAATVLWSARRLASLGWAVGLGFLLAGVLGNLTDRVFREPSVGHGHVVDFLALPHFPVFNVADMCINVAAACIIVQALRGVGLSGRRD